MALKLGAFSLESTGVRLPTWDTLAIRLRGLIAARLVALTSALLPVLILDITLEEGVPGRSFLAAWAAAAYFASLVYSVLLLRRRPHLRWQAYLQFLGDLALITVLVWHYGAFGNPLSILYLVVVTVASVFLRRRAGIAIATLAWLAYVAMLYLELASGGEVHPAVVGRAVYYAGIHLTGFYAVALLTSGLARTVTRTEIELQEKRADLADLRVAHRDVVSSIPSGIVTTNADGRITSANRAAEDILGHPEDRLAQLRLEELDLFDRAGWEELVARADQHERIREESDYEVGNPLAAISGSVQMLSDSFPQESAQHKLLDIISKESTRLDRTIKGFLQFARPKARASVRFDIARQLAENVELLVNSPEVSADHQVELALDPPNATLLADPDQVSQIFWNLTRNALRAMESGGVLKIVGTVDAAVYRLQFIDSGRGMSEEERAKLFHPFRSFFDGGTGIGMAIVYRIVEEHNGRLWVESRPGEGTAITVELPGVETARDSLPAEVRVK